MAAPTQVFPPWLTPVPVTTEVNGAQAVETSIKFIPLTYFGPSIPLGSVFTFGGSTFPPTVEFGPQSTSISSPTSTSSSSSTSQSATTSPSTSTTPTSTTTSSPRATSSASQSTQSPVSASANSHGLSTGTKLAIGISIGVVFLLLLALLLVLLRVRRRRAVRSTNRFSDSDWQIVGSHDINQDAGGEAEVLLPEERVMRQRASLSSTPALTPWMRTAYEPVVTATATESVPRNSENSARSAAGDKWSTSHPTGSRSTIAASSLFFNPAKSRGEGARQAEEKTTTSRDGSSFAGDPSSSASSRNYAILPAGASPPLFPPRSYRNYQAPNLDDDDFVPPTIMFASPPRSRSRHHSTDSLPYPESPPSETDERATLLTAQRVELGPQVTATSLSPQDRNRSLSPEEHPESFGLTSLAGLTRLAGLNRFSWFRRMENRPPTGYRHSSPPLVPSDELPRTSSFNRLSFHPGSRPHSGILYPGFGSRPMSDISYTGLADNELGLRPPTIHISTGGSSGSPSRSGNGSGSGRTTYHSALSRPGSFYPQPQPTSQLRSQLGEGELIDVRDTFPGLDIAQDSIRPVDVLDMPVPEPTLPLQAALSPDNVVSRSSSRGSPHFPPGLVAVPRWNSASTSNPDVDILDQAPPRSPGEWSSMKSKQASSHSPVERAADVEHNVEVTSAQGAVSEEGIIESGRPFSPGSPNALGFSLTPRVSLYAPSDHISHGSGSHSSRPSEHTTYSRETRGSSNDPLSDDEYHPPGIQRASLSAIGGGQVRRKPSTVAGRVLPAPEERTSEEEKSGGGSRPVSIASAGSRPTVSETVVSRTPTTVQAFDSVGKTSGQEVASIINVLQSSEQRSPDKP